MKWHAKKITAQGPNKGKWGVNSPDGIRRAVCDSKWEAEALAYTLRCAAATLAGVWTEAVKRAKE